VTGGAHTKRLLAVRKRELAATIHHAHRRLNVTLMLQNNAKRKRLKKEEKREKGEAYCLLDSYSKIRIMTFVGIIRNNKSTMTKPSFRPFL
jgi:hypothetical protein